MSIGEVIATESIYVEDERTLEVATETHHLYDSTENAFVLSSRFFDKDNNEIKDRLPGMASSNKFNNYTYLDAGPKANPNKSHISLIIPSGARRATVDVTVWREMVKPAASISIGLPEPTSSISLPPGFYQIVRPISPAWRYHFQIQIINAELSDIIPGTLEIEYLTKELKTLQPIRGEYLHWSRRYKAFFRYLPSGTSDGILIHELNPPRSTAYCIIRLRNTSERTIDAQIHGPIESSLDWDNPNRNEIRTELRITDLKESRNSMRAITELVPSAAGPNAVSYEFSIRRGELTAAKDSAAAAFKEDPGARSLHRLRYISEMLETLDPDWTPLLGRGTVKEYEADMRTVLHLFKVAYPFESTGGAIRNLNVVKCQKEEGWNPVVTTPLGYPRSHGFLDIEPIRAVEGVRHIQLDIGSAPSQVLRYASRHLEFNTFMLQSIVEKERPCLIHAASGYRGFEMAVMANALSKRYGIPWIYEVRSFHEQTWTDDRQFAVDSQRTRMREKRENSLMKEADKVVTISESMRRALVERGVDSGNISVVPNAMDASMFSPGKKKLKLARSLDLHKRFVIGYISNMSMREGHDILVKAFNIVSESIEDARLLLVGEGKERESISRLVSNYGISDKVIMTGEIDHRDVVDYYRLIDLFVVPRRRDYAADLVTPMKPYEAMALEIPIIVSDREALIEIIGEERGRSFETEDAEDLARVILDCHSNYSDCEKTAESAREWLVENRTWKQNGEKYAKLYEQLTESPIR